MNNLSFGANWVDLVILLVLAYYVFEALRHGFLIMLTDFVSFLTSLLVSLSTYRFASEILQKNFGLAGSVSNAVGFLITAILTEAILGFVFAAILSRITPKLKFNDKKVSKFLAVIPAVGEGLIIVSIVVSLIVALPIKPSVKKDVLDSRIAGYLIKRTTQLDHSINDIFGGVIEDSLTYLTIRPGSTETIPLTSEVVELKVDEVSESKLFNLVNEERRKAGVSELSLRSEVVPIARSHAKDMWERRYFSHVSPEGKDVGTRLDEGNVDYTFAGENLALAPSVSTAHTGLMNSEGHRANILEPNFKRMGVGVIDNGIYGKMFVQVFTD